MLENAMLEITDQEYVKTLIDREYIACLIPENEFKTIYYEAFTELCVGAGFIMAVFIFGFYLLTRYL
jgi:hypothetical protein